MEEQQLYVLLHSQEGPPALYHQSFGDLEMMAAGVSGIFEKFSDAEAALLAEHYEQFSEEEIRAIGEKNRNHIGYEALVETYNDLPEISFEQRVAELQSYAAEAGGIFERIDEDDYLENVVPREANLLVVNVSRSEICYKARDSLQRKMWPILGELHIDYGFSIIHRELGMYIREE